MEKWKVIKEDDAYYVIRKDKYIYLNIANTETIFPHPFFTLEAAEKVLKRANAKWEPQQLLLDLGYEDWYATDGRNFLNSKGKVVSCAISFIEKKDAEKAIENYERNQQVTTAAPQVVDWSQPLQTDENPPRKARLICEDRRSQTEYDHIILVENKGGEEVIWHCNKNGRANVCLSVPVRIINVPAKVRVYMKLAIKIYYFPSWGYKTREEFDLRYGADHRQLRIAIAQIVKGDNQQLYWEHMEIYSASEYLKKGLTHDLPVLHLEDEWIHWDCHHLIPFKHEHLEKIQWISPNQDGDL